MCPAGSASHVPQAAPWHGDLLRVKKCASSSKLSRAPQAAVTMCNTAFILHSCVLHGPKLCLCPVQSCLTFAVLHAAALLGFYRLPTTAGEMLPGVVLVLLALDVDAVIGSSLVQFLTVCITCCCLSSQQQPIQQHSSGTKSACTRGINCYRPAGGSAAPAPCTSLCCSVIGLL